MLKQMICLTFAKDKFCAKKHVEVEGNCPIKDVVDAAVKSAFKELSEFRGMKAIMLRHGYGTWLCTDGDRKKEKWLKEMLIKAEIEIKEYE